MSRPTGRVVGIIKRNWRPLCGMLSKSQIKEVSRSFVCCQCTFLLKIYIYSYSFSSFPCLQARRHLFTPADRRIPRIRIETRQASTLEGQRIIVAIDGWPRNSRYPNVSLKYKIIFFSVMYPLDFYKIIVLIWGCTNNSIMVDNLQ